MIWAELILAASLRFVLAGIYGSDTPPIEFAGPTTSHSRVVEALYLKAHHRSIYEGSSFHQPPLVFLWFWLVNCTRSLDLLKALTVVIDLAIGYMIYEIAVRNRRNRGSLSADIPDEKQLLNDDAGLERMVLRIYLFNPLTVLSCISLSTASFTHFFVVLSIYLAFNGRPATSALALSFAVYVELINIVLAIPLVLILHFSQLKLTEMNWRRPIRFRFSRTTFCFLCFLLATSSILVVLSFASTGSFEWIRHTYQFVFGVHELTPNVGIFWYFVTEVFPRFRLFFLICFHAQIFVYVIPLTIRFWHNPLFLLYVLLHLMAMLKPYPVFGDYGLVYTMLFLQWGILKRMRSLFPVYVPLVISFAMSNLIWHMWIELGSANPNFYYFMSLVCSFSNGLILTEAILAVRLLYAEIE